MSVTTGSNDIDFDNTEELDIPRLAESRRHHRGRTYAPQAAVGRRLPDLRPLRLRRGHRRTHHRTGPRVPDRFWVNPYAVHFSRIRVSDLLLIDEEGRVIEGDRRTNKAAF
ncbi:class II aldolase/adducin family protein [Streptomyces sp. L7]